MNGLYRAVLYCVSVLSLSATQSFALTPAGHVISNIAVLTYNQQDEVQTATSNETSFKVLQLLDVAAVTLDSNPVLVNSPDVTAALTFKVTNIGNGAESYFLERNDNVLSSEFMVETPSTKQSDIYIESGLQAGFQKDGPNADILYTTGVNTITLAAGEDKIVYLLSHVPANVDDNKTSISQLVAKSAIAGVTGAQAGSLVDGSEAVLGQVVGLTVGLAQATSVYKVNGLKPRINKTIVKIIDPNGSNQVTEGSTVTYQIEYTVNGVGVIKDLIIEDPLPEHLHYISNSVTVDGMSQTDVADGDNVEVTNSVVKVVLGQVQAPIQKLIRFDASIQ